MVRPLDLIVEEMLDYIEQASTYARGLSFEQYASDRKTQRAVERCIEVISEASRHIPDEIKDKHPAIPWRDVAAVGNVFRHEYHNIASRIVWDTVRLHLPPLEAAVRAIEAELQPNDNEPRPTDAVLVELLTVADHFHLQHHGVVVKPDFALPAGGWKSCSKTVVIVTPDGRNHEATARLEIWHFNIRDPAVSAEERWGLVVSFPTMTKAEIPIGSKILIPQSLEELDAASSKLMTTPHLLSPTLPIFSNV
jgi:uncharacterized protein with HEPN domain